MLCSSVFTLSVVVVNDIVAPALGEPSASWGETEPQFLMTSSHRVGPNLWSLNLEASPLACSISFPR